MWERVSPLGLKQTSISIWVCYGRSRVHTNTPKSEGGLAELGLCRAIPDDSSKKLHNTSYIMEGIGGTYLYPMIQEDKMKSCHVTVK
jgi:hypothetical protein